MQGYFQNGCYVV